MRSSSSPANNAPRLANDKSWSIKGLARLMGGACVDAGGRRLRDGVIRNRRNAGDDRYGNGEGEKRLADMVLTPEFKEARFSHCETASSREAIRAFGFWNARRDGGISLEPRPPGSGTARRRKALADDCHSPRSP